jgi:hypothetical protein
MTLRDRYSSPEQRDRFERLAAALNLDLADLERLTPDPLAFETAVLRGELGPFIRLMLEAVTTRPRV